MTTSRNAVRAIAARTAGALLVVALASSCERPQAPPAVEAKTPAPAEAPAPDEPVVVKGAATDDGDASGPAVTAGGNTYRLSEIQSFCNRPRGRLASRPRPRGLFFFARVLAMSQPSPRPSPVRRERVPPRLRMRVNLSRRSDRPVGRAAQAPRCGTARSVWSARASAPLSHGPSAITVIAKRR